MKVSQWHVVLFIGLVFCFEFLTHSNSQRLGNDILSHRSGVSGGGGGASGGVGGSASGSGDGGVSFEQQPPPPQDPFPAQNSKIMLKAPTQTGAGASAGSGTGDIDGDRVGVAGGDSGGDGDGDGEWRSLVFSPSILRYDSSPVCIPKVSTFTITNNDPSEDDIQLISIAADNPQFYPVLFQPQSLSPKNSIQIRILFLPFYAQAAGATLTISTSKGSFEYAIEGAPAYNAYRLQPFVGYKIPSGVPFEQPITIHNPHSEVLRIREIFTTEEFLSLRGAMASDEMGNGTTTSVTSARSSMGDDVWELEPGTEHTVIHLSMGSSVPGSYMGYVHLKTDRDNIVIPVDLQVLEGGLHATPDLINFGILTTSNDVGEVDLYLLNSGTKTVEVIDIVPVQADPNLQLTFHHSPEERILVNGTNTKIATLKYMSSEHSMKVSNKLLVITNHSNPALATLEIPYEASTVHGGIGHEDPSQLLFTLPIRNLTSTSKRGGQGQLTGAKAVWSDEDKKDIIRTITLTNYFSVPLGVLSVDLVHCPGLFSLLEYDTDITEDGDSHDDEHRGDDDNMDNRSPFNTVYSVPSLGTLRTLNLVFHKAVAYARFSNQLDTMPTECHLEIMTNISGAVHIPLTIATGAIQATSLTKAIALPTTESLKSKKDKESKKYTNMDYYAYDMGNVSATNPVPIALQFSNANPMDVVFTVTGTSAPLEKVCYSRLNTVDDLSTESSDNDRVQLPKKITQLPKLPFFYPDLPCEGSSSDLIYYFSSSSPPVDSSDSHNDLLEDDHSGVQFVLKPGSNVTIRFYFQNFTIGPSVLNFSLSSKYQVKKYEFHYNGVEGNLLNAYPSSQTKMLMGIHDSVNIFSHSTFAGPIKLNSVHTSSPLMQVNLQSGVSDGDNCAKGEDCNLEDMVSDTSVLFFTPSSEGSGDMGGVDSHAPEEGHVKGVMTARISAPDLLCMDPKTSSIALWDCIDVILQTWKRYEDKYWLYDQQSSQKEEFYALTEGSDSAVDARSSDDVEKSVPPGYLQRPDNLKAVPNPADVSEFALHEMFVFIRDILAKHASEQYEIAFIGLSNFRELWLSAFPDGIHMPDVDVLFKSTLMYSYLSIKDLFVQLPFKTTSGFYEYSAPPIEHGQAMLFYVAVYNPYSVPISASFGNPKLARTDVDGLFDSHHPGLSMSQVQPRRYLANQSIPPFLDANTPSMRNSVKTCVSSRRQGEVAGKKSRTKVSFSSDNLYVPESLSPTQWGSLWTDERGDDSGYSKQSRRHQRSTAFIKTNAIASVHPRVPTEMDVSALTSGDHPSRDECLHMVNSVVMVPQFLKQSQYSTRHAVFSVLKEPPLKGISTSDPVEQRLELAPYESDILGPVLFIPPNTANIIYNLSLYVVNNYTGVERIDVVFGSGSISMQLNGARVFDTPHATVNSTALPGNRNSENEPDGDNATTTPKSTVALLENSRHSVRNSNRYTIPLQFAPVTKPQTSRDYVSVNASSQSFTLQTRMVNDGKLDIIIDEIFEGRTGRNLCNSSDYYGVEGRQDGWLGLKTMLLSLYRRIDMWSPTNDNSRVEIIHLCDQLPLRLDSRSGLGMDLAVTTDCIVASDYFVIQLVSSVHRSSILDIFVMVDLSDGLKDQCRINQLQTSPEFIHVLNFLGVVLGLLCIVQLSQVSNFSSRAKDIIKSKDSAGRGGDGSNSKSDGGGSNDILGLKKFVHIPAELVNTNQKGSSTGKFRGAVGSAGSSVASFSYLPKNVNLSDVYPDSSPLDEGDYPSEELLAHHKEVIIANMELDAVDLLRNRRQERLSQPQPNITVSPVATSKDSRKAMPSSDVSSSSSPAKLQTKGVNNESVKKSSDHNVSDMSSNVDDDRDMILVSKGKKANKLKEKEKSKVVNGSGKTNRSVENLKSGSAKAGTSAPSSGGKGKIQTQPPPKNVKPLTVGEKKRSVSTSESTVNQSQSPKQVNIPQSGPPGVGPVLQIAPTISGYPSSSLPPNPLAPPASHGQPVNSHVSGLPSQLGGFQFGLIPGTLGSSSMPGMMPGASAIAMPSQKAPPLSSVVSPSVDPKTLSPAGLSMAIKPSLLPPPLQIGGQGNSQGQPSSPPHSHSHLRRPHGSSHALDSLMSDIMDFESFDKLLDSANNTPRGSRKSGSKGADAHIIFPSSNDSGLSSHQQFQSSADSFQWRGPEPQASTVGGSGAPPPGFMGTDVSSSSTPDMPGGSSGMFTSSMFHNNNGHGSEEGKRHQLTESPPGTMTQSHPTPPNDFFSTPTSSPRSHYFNSSSPPSASSSKMPFALPMAEPSLSQNPVSSANEGRSDDDNDANFLDMLTMPWEDMEDRFGSISRISDIGTGSGGFNISSLMDSAAFGSSGFGEPNVSGGYSGSGGRGSLFNNDLQPAPSIQSSSTSTSSSVLIDQFATPSNNGLSASSQSFSPKVSLGGSPRSGLSIAPALSAMPVSPNRLSSSRGGVGGINSSTLPSGGASASSLMNVPSLLSQQEENLFFGANGIFGIQPSTSASTTPGGNNNNNKHPVPVATTNIAPGLGGVVSGGHNSTAGSSGASVGGALSGLGGKSNAGGHDFGKDIYFSHTYSSSQREKYNERKRASKK